MYERSNTLDGSSKHDTHAHGVPSGDAVAATSSGFSAMLAHPFPLQVDLGRALDEGRWSAFQKRLLAFAALAFAVDGIANQVLGLAVPALIRDWGTPRAAFAAVAAAGLVGVAIGAILGGVVGDRLGRRVGLTGSVLLFGVMTAASAGVHQLSELTSLRLLAGLGIGGAIPNGAALISEFTPLRHRGLAIASGMLFIPVGGVVAALLGTVILPQFGWRGLFLIAGALPVLLGGAFCVALPESPAFLARLEHRRAELLAILNRCDQHFDPDCEFLDERLARPRTPVGALFGAGVMTDTLALWVAFFFCLLASYSMFSWVPTLLASDGFGLSVTSLGMTAFNTGGMVGAMAGGWLLGRVGSRISVLGLAGGAVVGALALGWVPASPAHGATSIMCALIAEGFFIGGLHNGLYTLAALIYPPFVRATGVGAAAGVGRIGAVLSSYTGVLSLELGGASSYFLVIAASCGVSVVAIALIRQHIPRTSRPIPH